MSLMKYFKKWVMSEKAQPVDQSGPQTPETPMLLVSDYSHMVGEPVTSFILSLKREPNRYKLEKLLKLPSSDFPRFTCYHWMHGAGWYTLLDRKTGVKYGAYTHDCESVYQVYGLPFQLNHWELVALYRAFEDFRAKARERSEGILQASRQRARLEQQLKEKQDRLAFAEQFK